MHRSIRDNLEQVLAGSRAESRTQEHLTNCEECSGEVSAMLAQARLLRNLRAEAEPTPGFYARVMEHIEAQTSVSIWSLFGESAFGRSVAMASMMVAILLGTYLFTAERAEHHFRSTPDAAPLVWDQSGTPDRADVLVNLVTYQEQ